MNYFSPGFREIVRIGQRTAHRVRVFLLHRKLGKAETTLGLLGWQQADFDANTQRQVDALQDIERTQSRVNNRSAELAREIKELTEKRAQWRATWDQQRTTLEGERAVVVEPLTELRRRISALRASVTDAERQRAQLDDEQRDIERASDKLLLVQPQPPETRAEIMRLRTRILAIDGEREALKTTTERHSTELAVLEQQAVSEEERITALDGRLEEFRREFATADSELAKVEAERTKEKEDAETELNHLEYAKSDPYREIGRVLADHNIAPMNQPEALSRVHELRGEIEAHKTSIEVLLEETRSAPQADVRISMALIGCIVLALLLIIAALF